MTTTTLDWMVKHLTETPEQCEKLKKTFEENPSFVKEWIRLSLFNWSMVAIVEVPDIEIEVCSLDEDGDALFNKLRARVMSQPTPAPTV